ncbi:cupin domain-containing protein [Chryseobacterium sp. c4a]|uniref:cupin domain-containing protein n=1 Tax=Chryseobacterium sp. c4a TaxID=1573582 RepID=UPI00135BA8C3|nr:cupin domain-containing protein [Chryseobacterium sp. c4a]
MKISPIKIVDNHQGQLLGIAGGNYRILISGEETNGAYAVIEMSVPPGGGPAPHAHPDTQEMFYIVEGALEFKTEQGKVLLQEGGFVNIPLGGEIHCFQNTSDKFARLLCTVVPAGLEQMFKEVGIPVKDGEFPPIPEITPERIAFLQEINKKYDITTYPNDYLG